MQANIDEDLLIDNYEPICALEHHEEAPVRYRNERRVSVDYVGIKGKFNTLTYSLASPSFVTEGIIELSGLTTGQFHTYGVPYDAFRESDKLQDAVLVARESLNTCHLPREGFALVNAKMLNTHVITMANLVPTMADQQGRPYTEAHKAAWRVVIGTLWTLLLHHRGQRLEIGGLVTRMKSILTDIFRTADHECNVSRLLDGNVAMSADLDSLIRHVVYVCY